MSYRGRLRDLLLKRSAQPEDDSVEERPAKRARNDAENSEGSPDQCRMCGNKCNSIVLHSGMKPEVQMYFTNPVELFRKYVTPILQVLEFQNSHRMRLMAHKQKEHVAIQEENSHLKRMLAGSTSRGCTPYSSRGSPGTTPIRRSHTPSPTGSKYSASPYSRSTPTSLQVDSLKQHHWQNQLARTPAGPTRLSVRAPPSNGAMGPVRGSPSPNTQLLSRPGSAGGTPGAIHRSYLRGMHVGKIASTPGTYEATTPTGLRASVVANSSSYSGGSPMISGRSSSTPSSGRLNGRPLYTAPSSSQVSTEVLSSNPYQTEQYDSQNTLEDELMTPSSQLDPSRRQIQLRYQPRSAVINKSRFLTTPTSSQLR